MAAMFSTAKQIWKEKDTSRLISQYNAAPQKSFERFLLRFSHPIKTGKAARSLHGEIQKLKSPQPDPVASTAALLAIFLEGELHSLKTQITVISGRAQIIAAQPEKLTDVQKDSIEIIMNSLKYAKDSSVDNLNLLQLVLEGRATAKPVPLMQKEVASAIVQMANAFSSCGKIAEISMPSGEPVYLVANWRFAMKILENLVSNAFKYSDKQVSISFAEEGNTLHFVVGNDGSGIPSEEQESIFRHAKRKKSEGDCAMHLGLFYCKTLADLFGWKLSFSSESGKTAFTLEVPFTKQ